MHEKLGRREIAILSDYMNMWTRSIIELLQKLKDTTPKEGILGEVHYWRDLARVLEAITSELKQSFVETVVQILACEESDDVLQRDIRAFYQEKERVFSGNKEAMWNHKYMKVIEKPVQTIEKAEDLKQIQMTTGILLKTLENIFENSNFYKEMRMVSFLDRLLQTILSKIKRRVNLSKALKEASQGPKSAESFINNQITGAIMCINKYSEAFFIRERMQSKNGDQKVREALGGDESKEGEEEEKKDATAAFDQSFYRKKGLDFLNF